MFDWLSRWGRRWLIIAMAGGLVVGMSRCDIDDDDDDDDEWETEISTYNSRESHKTGSDCGSCHRPGQNEYVFSVAGSVYKADRQTPAPGATVYLYTQPQAQGELVLRLEVDRYGNFYTTEPLSRNIQELYPTVVGASGATHHMKTWAHTGNCNSCHGSSQPVIWVNE